MQRPENDLPAGFCMIFVGVVMIGLVMLPDATDGDQTAAVVMGTLMLIIGCFVTIKECIGMSDCCQHDPILTSHEYVRIYGIDGIP
jgi:uncharacterized protein (DUF983 family)